jgi:hypothetical protein
MRLFRLPESLSRDARCETGIVPQPPSRERGLVLPPMRGRASKTRTKGLTRIFGGERNTSPPWSSPP